MQENLVAKCRALNEEGITAYHWAGSYRCGSCVSCLSCPGMHPLDCAARCMGCCFTVDISWTCAAAMQGCSLATTGAALCMMQGPAGDDNRQRAAGHVRHRILHWGRRNCGLRPPQQLPHAARAGAHRQVSAAHQPAARAPNAPGSMHRTKGAAGGTPVHALP